MKKLELEPSTYEKEFTKLTGGINIEIQNWILDRVGQSKEILEVGCGPGALAIKMAKNNNIVTAIDSNPNMIQAAKTTAAFNSDLKITFLEGSAVTTPSETYDAIVSTFMLSELRPLEQQIFLRSMWKSLKKGGKLLLAAEFEPSGFWKLQFMIKRWWYKKRLKKLRSGDTHPLKWFLNYIKPIGFKITSESSWERDSIRVYEFEKVTEGLNDNPGYYRPEKVPFRGFKALLNNIRCIFTGQVDHVPIEPGIYKSGDPNSSSPIIVTANYVYTYIRVMKDIQGIDAWVLVVDSRGINVWCAARGPDFGNKQVLEAVEATEIKDLTDKKILYLPQLSAGGVAIPELPKKSQDFPFTVKFGPVWSKHLPEYLKDLPKKKPDEMKLARFTLSHRMRGFLTHSTFLLRKIFMKPTFLLLFYLLILLKFDILWVVGDLWFSVIFANFILTLLFPITKFTRKFVTKGILIGLISTPILSFILLGFHQSVPYVLWMLCFNFWVAFFSTMSFSGYTFSTGPREIAEEYSLFRPMNLVLLIVGTILSLIGITFML